MFDHPGLLILLCIIAYLAGSIGCTCASEFGSKRTAQYGMVAAIGMALITTMYGTIGNDLYPDHGSLFRDMNEHILLIIVGLFLMWMCGIAVSDCRKGRAKGLKFKNKNPAG